MTFEERARILTRRFGDRTAAAMLDLDPSDIHAMQLGDALEEPAAPGGGGGTLVGGDEITLNAPALPDSTPITPQDDEVVTLVTLVFTADLSAGDDQIAAAGLVSAPDGSYDAPELGFQWFVTQADAAGASQITDTKMLVVPAGRTYLVSISSGMSCSVWRERPLALV